MTSGARLGILGSAGHWVFKHDWSDLLSLQGPTIAHIHSVNNFLHHGQKKPLGYDFCCLVFLLSKK